MLSSPVKICKTFFYSEPFLASLPTCCGISVLRMSTLLRERSSHFTFKETIISESQGPAKFLSFLQYNRLPVDSCQASPARNTCHTALDTLYSNDSSTHLCPSLDLPKGRNHVLFICKLQREACSLV